MNWARRPVVLMAFLLMGGWLTAFVQTRMESRAVSCFQDIMSWKQDILFYEVRDLKFIVEANHRIGARGAPKDSEQSDTLAKLEKLKAEQLERSIENRDLVNRLFARELECRKVSDRGSLSGVIYLFFAFLAALYGFWVGSRRNDQTG